MNFAQMLLTPVTPLYAHEPSEQSVPRVENSSKRPRKHWERSISCANEVRHAKAIAKYRSAMPNGEWVSTSLIERRLGMSQASCTGLLQKWTEEGILECRKRGPIDQWNRNKGYEWRFIK